MERKDVAFQREQIESNPSISAAMTLILMAREYENALEDGFRGLSLSIRKFSVLGYLRHGPQPSITTLAKEAKITVQSMHVIVRSMIDDGLVAVTGVGGRGHSARLELTEAGNEAIVAGFALLDRLDIEWFVESNDPMIRKLGATLRGLGLKRFREKLASRLG